MFAKLTMQSSIDNSLDEVLSPATDDDDESGGKDDGKGVKIFTGYFHHSTL